MNPGDCFECEGVTVQVDFVENDDVFYAKYRAHIGEQGTVDNFLGFFRMPIEQFAEEIKKAEKADARCEAESEGVRG